MNVEIGAEAPLFPEKEYISGVFVAVWFDHKNSILKFFYCGKSACFSGRSSLQSCGRQIRPELWRHVCFRHHCLYRVDHMYLKVTVGWVRFVTSSMPTVIKRKDLIKFLVRAKLGWYSEVFMQCIKRIYLYECLSRQSSLVINIVGTDDISRLPR